MKTRSNVPVVLLLLAVVFLGGGEARSADLLDWLGLRRGSASTRGLSEEVITSGLKEALARGVEQAVTRLGRTDGFLADAAVRIPLPEGMHWAETALQAAGQERVVNDFVTTLNRAAEEAVPQAGPVLGDAIRQLTVADARSILTATNAAATEFFRRTSETNLQARLRPIVEAATARTGLTATYKQMLDKAGIGRLGNLGALGGLGRLGTLGQSLTQADALDLDGYVTRKALDGLFVKIADEEQRIRDDPTARATELLQKVFGRKTR